MAHRRGSPTLSTNDRWSLRDEHAAGVRRTSCTPSTPLRRHTARAAGADRAGRTPESTSARGRGQAQSWPSRRSSASSSGALVGAGGEVLPAAVADDERDVGALPRLDRLGRLAQRRVQDRAGGDAGEDALLLEQLADPAYGVARADREAGVDQRRRRRARGRSPRRGCAGRRPARRSAARRRRSRRSGLCSRKKRPTPISVPVVPRPATKCVIVGRSARISGPVPCVVRERVGRVAVLVEHHPVGVLARRAPWRPAPPRWSRRPPGEETISAPHIRSSWRRSSEVFSGITQTSR